MNGNGFPHISLQQPGGFFQLFSIDRFTIDDPDHIARFQTCFFRGTFRVCGKHFQTAQTQDHKNADPHFFAAGFFLRFVKDFFRLINTVRIQFFQQPPQRKIEKTFVGYFLLIHIVLPDQLQGMEKLLESCCRTVRFRLRFCPQGKSALHKDHAEQNE